MIERDGQLLPLLELARRTRSAGSASVAVVERTLRYGEMPPLHMHEHEEGFYVVEGSLTIYVGGDAVRLEPGDSFLAPKGVPHTFRAESERVRYLATAFVASAARYEDFLRAVGRESAGDETWHAEEAATLGVIASALGITLLGAPGALPA